MNNAALTTTPDRTVSEIMSTDLMTLKLTDTLRLADDMMNLAHVRHFPVLDQGKIVGVVNQDDLLHASMASLVHHPKDTPRQALATVAVKDVMKPPTTITPETSIYDSAAIMVEKGIECLLVVDGESLVGLITRTDLLRQLARR
jgi:CBS domain-containing membrane protein